MVYGASYNDRLLVFLSLQIVSKRILITQYNQIVPGKGPKTLRPHFLLRGIPYPPNKQVSGAKDYIRLYKIMFTTGPGGMTTDWGGGYGHPR